jgi:hypothetical protein
MRMAARQRVQGLITHLARNPARPAVFRSGWAARDVGCLHPGPAGHILRLMGAVARLTRWSWAWWPGMV